MYSLLHYALDYGVWNTITVVWPIAWRKHSHHPNALPSAGQCGAPVARCADRIAQQAARVLQGGLDPGWQPVVREYCHILWMLLTSEARYATYLSAPVLQGVWLGGGHQTSAQL